MMFSEFSFEHDIEHVRQATTEREIDYPVALDNDYEVWSAFDNHYWPALHFVVADGIIRDHHFGEGRYDTRSASSSGCWASSANSSPSSGSAWRRRPTGPITYARDVSRLRARRRFASPGARARRTPGLGAARATAPNHWALAGEWTIGPENVVLAQAGESIAYRFDARDAHLVLSPGTHEPIPFRVLLDGKAPGPSHGVDVDENGNGLLRNGLYQLVRQHDAVRERTLEITFLEPGTEAYAFTFG